MIIRSNIESYIDCLDKIEAQLRKYKLTDKDVNKSRLLCEEVISDLVDHKSNDAKEIKVSIYKRFGDIFVEISLHGSSFDFEASLDAGISLDDDELGVEAQNTIRGMILKSFMQDLRYKNQAGINIIRFKALSSSKKQLYYTIGALAMAILAGLAMKVLLPEFINNIVNTDLLIPIKTMFMNCLKMVVAPVVFFSIISAISQFGSLSQIGRIGGKIFGLYLITTVVATVIGIGISVLYHPGNMIVASDGLVEASELSVSIKDIIVGIVPTNFVKPFVESDMLQLIFLAILCGIASGMIGKYSKTINDFFEACNQLFLKITTIVTKAIPLAVFCSISSLILSTGVETLLPILNICLLFFFGLAIMMVVYCLLILVIGRLNPLPFVKKYGAIMPTVAATASSNAALLLNMNACDKKLGISSRVYSLSLPLGATVNMDGACIYLALVPICFAKLYGIEVGVASLIPVGLSVIMLSIGAPGVPGSGLICLAVMLSQLGVPAEAIGLIMGIDPLLGMIRVMSNCLGDVAVSLIVANSEKLVDVGRYKSDK